MNLLAMCCIIACQSPSSSSQPHAFRAFGTLREVLHDGHSQARVSILDAVHPGTIGVGAMERLDGEVTIVDGKALVSRAHGNPAAITVREATSADRAALLHVATVHDWSEIALPACSSYAELEAAIASALHARGIALSEATPVRVRGRAERFHLHVIAGACPSAHPEGPPPARLEGTNEDIELVGFFADAASGVLTHHDRRSHLHAITAAGVGHLDDVQLASCSLFVAKE